MIHGGDMSDLLWGMIMGTFCTLIAIGAVSRFNQDSPQNIIKNAIYECEKNLPRDQHCYIIAVPPDKD
jgi:hypothetical protein